MLSALRGSALCYLSPSINHQWRNLDFSLIFSHTVASLAADRKESSDIKKNREPLSLAEVEKILNDVGADDVKVISAPIGFEFTDYMVVATGRSPWHVRNISQALIYKVKQKQKGAQRMLLPTVVGQEGGKWIVIDSGTLIIHAVDENARAYYNFEGLWNTDIAKMEHTEDLGKAFDKVRRKNNSKKRSHA